MVRKNDIIELDITGMTHEGMGVGKKDGFAVFVQGAIDGEKVRAKIIKVLKNYAVARIDEFIEKSPFRKEPFCPVYKRCGGCGLQHMSYEKTLSFKRQIVIDNLTRLGGLENITVENTIGMEKPYNYRNKAQYPVGEGKSGPISGFFAKRSHEIIESDICGIQHPVSDKAKSIVLEYMREYSVSAYSEKSGQGLIRHVVTKTGFYTNETMVIIVATKSKMPHAKELITMLKEEITGLKSIVLNINSKRGNVILGQQNITLYGSDTITDRLGSLYFEISPLSFYQVNPVQTEILYNKAIEFSNLTGKETVFDLYCGIGTISLFAAQKAKKVIGVEIVEEAIEAAKRNASRNNLNNTEFYVGKAEEIVPQLYEKGIKADVVLVDPPRKGCDEQLLKTLVDMSPERIVYVSCNPSTLARDLKYLSANDFELKEVQPVDMFPWTQHVECVVLMSRVE
ncbi:MAG: 23S rRNA (uracil(1939)-C(5))-methyltransferase RlmD, partial [Clostridiaceae bacterium]|nr:23S rRNA (uracil(1939)-C(5))-methyltransferase RlmD [Clostridiaceae bacterium]